MDDITDVQGNVIGISFTSTVRGQKIHFNDDSLNAAIGIKDAKYRIWEKYEKYPEDGYWKLLGLEGKDKKTPAGMSNTHRLLHMVYSRLMVNKFGNFTNLTDQDNPILGRLIAKEPINPGMLIIQEMKRFLLKGTSKTTFPFLQVISCLLKLERIWPTQHNPSPIGKFSATNLRKMKLISSDKAKIGRAHV